MRYIEGEREEVFAYKYTQQERERKGQCYLLIQNVPDKQENVSSP